MRVWRHSHSYPTQSKELWERGCDRWQVPPQLYHGHEELKRTVEEDFPKVFADLEALLKTNFLSSTVVASCFWRLLCTLPPLLLCPHFSTLPHLQPESTFLGPWGNKQLVWRRGLESMARKHSLLSLQQRVAPSFYCVSLWTGWGGVFIPH